MREVLSIWIDATYLREASLCQELCREYTHGIKQGPVKHFIYSSPRSVCLTPTPVRHHLLTEIRFEKCVFVDFVVVRTS